MKKKCKISIVLASFNGEKFIAEQIHSFLDFIDKDDEIIISDDGSTDSTIAVVNSISDSRILVLPVGEHVGYQGNFERAIAASSGDIILFSDQDDICLLERFKYSLHDLKFYSLVAGDAIIVDEHLSTLSDSYFLARNVKNFTFLSLFFKPKIIGATVAVSRDFLKYSLPFPKGIPHDHWLSILASFNNCLSVRSEKFIMYRRHSNVVTNWGKGSRRSIFKVIHERLIIILNLIKKILFSGFFKQDFH